MPKNNLLIYPDLFRTKDKITFVEKHYRAKYVGCFQHPKNSLKCVEVFYQDGPPHEVSKSNYMCLFHNNHNVVISEWQEDWINQNAVETNKKEYIYSRDRHDYFVKDGAMVDGGASYTRSSISPIKKITCKDGKLMLDSEPCNTVLTFLKKD